jgi:hypothetical protein
MNNQTKRLYDYLNQGNKIDPLTSWTELGIYRLASRITDLKDAEIKIGKGWKTVINRFGDKIKVREYWIEDEIKSN